MRYRCIIVTVLLNLWIVSAHSALNLELTQGISNQLPIMLVPFSGSEHLRAYFDLSSIIKDDLSNSGQFNVVVPQRGLPHVFSDMLTVEGRNKKFDYVVAGQIFVLNKAQYRVRFSLVNVTQKRGIALLQRDFNHVNEVQLRHLAHHISDLIYEKLIGIKGVFSTRIAYILVTDKNNYNRRYSLQVADMDGYNAKSLLVSKQPIMSPAWSHDGRRLAYVSFENVLPRIYIQTVNSGERELVSSYAGINGAPAWSPDDKTLALALSKDSAAPKIYLMSLSHKKLRQLTFGLSIDTEPSFSKDGRSLLFTSDRGGGPQIYQLDLASRAVHRVTYNGNYNARASFAVDGKTIAILNQVQGSYNIAVQNLKDDQTLQILTHSGYDASPSFAPNGQMLLYESKPGTRSILAMVSVDGRINMRLPTPQGDVQDPTWSPFTS